MESKLEINESSITLVLPIGKFVVSKVQDINGSTVRIKMGTGEFLTNQELFKRFNDKLLELILKNKNLLDSMVELSSPDLLKELC